MMIIFFKHDHDDDNDSKLQLIIEYCVLGTYRDISIFQFWNRQGCINIYNIHIQYTYFEINHVPASSLGHIIQ